MAPKLVNMLHQKIADAPPFGPSGVSHQSCIVRRFRLFRHDGIGQGEEHTLHAAISIDDAVAVALVPILVNEDLE